MWSFFFFFLGLVLGTTPLLIISAVHRREINQIDEEKELVNQEKEMVVTFMHGMVSAVGEGLGRKEMYRRIARSAVESTGASSACIFERSDENILKTVAVEGLFPPVKEISASLGAEGALRSELLEEVYSEQTYRVGEGLVGRVAKNQAGIFIKNGMLDPRAVKHTDPNLRIKSLILAPISFRGQLIGVIGVANPTDGLAFNERDFSLVQSLAEQIGLAVQTIDLLEFQSEKNKLDTELALASNIQSMLLPSKAPSVTGIEWDARYIPAQMIGGDLYDTIPLSGGKIGIAIADVSGKGIPASLLMAMCHTNLRHFAEVYEAPSKVLAAMNSSLGNDIRADMFITVLYAVFNPEDSSIRMARAGHENPILLRFEKDNLRYHQEMIRSEGVPIGMLPDSDFADCVSEVQFHLRDHDILILYTDGITEAENMQGDLFSTEKLQKIVRAHGNQSPREINHAILESLDRHVEQKGPGDDITLITLKKTPLPSNV